MNPLPLPEFFTYPNDKRAALAFSLDEYQKRLAGLRAIMRHHEITTVILTSYHNIAYYSGFLYCSFGRPYALVVTDDRAVTISANVDGGQPWRRSAFENLVYTDWKRDNYWRAVRSLITRRGAVGIEADHLTLFQATKLAEFLAAPKTIDIAPYTMQQRMIKSAAELELIRLAASIADIGGEAMIAAIKPGVREIEVAMAGRDAMELAIANHYPDSEIRDVWTWFQSGINTDGAHNPVTCRRLESGDVLSLNAFPMISSYYMALERTLFLGEPDPASLRIWQANVETHELGISLIKPGARCSDICDTLNQYLRERNLLKYRSFGYGHSFGILSQYYGREAGLELREDNDTVLQPQMVLSMEPMLLIPADSPGAGGYREHDVLIVNEYGAENITHTPYGPQHNIVPIHPKP